MTYYERLGVSPNATQKEIKKAYKRLVLLVHPDKVSGKEAEFNLIQEAYETLSDPEKRRIYNTSLFSLGSGLAHIVRLKRQGLKFYITETPELYDHYTFINAVFNWQGANALVPGQDISNEQHNTFWEMLNYVDYCLCRRKEYLERIHRNPTEKIKKELQLIELNLDKICAVIPVILGSIKRKRLYDLAMGFTQSDEMLEIGRLIGGIEGLIGHIKKEVHIDSAHGIFALRDAGCLTPENFKQLSLITSNMGVLSISLTLSRLFDENLLTQENFDCLLKQQTHALVIYKGLARLQLVGILNQQYFEALVSAKQGASRIGCNLEGLKLAGLLNDENFKIIQNNLVNDICPPLRAMRNIELNPEETKAVLLWKGPEELGLLNYRIDQMIAHGVYLLSEDADKGKTALLLGLELKKDLKMFFEQPLKVQQETEIAFKQLFMDKLHSKDKDMATHRALWKIIIANVAIAFTGLGLIALGIHYAVKGQCFFATTKREQAIENIAEINWSVPI